MNYKMLKDLPNVSLILEPYFHQTRGTPFEKHWYNWHNLFISFVPEFVVILIFIGRYVHLVSKKKY